MTARPANARVSGRLSLAVFAITWLWVGLLAFPFDGDDSNAVLEAAVNAVEKGEPIVSPEGSWDTSVVSGKHYSGFGPGATALAIPVYLAIRPWAGTLGRFAVAGHPGARRAPPEVGALRLAVIFLVAGPLYGAFARLLFRYFAEVGGAPPAAAAACALVAAAGTLLFPYACKFSRHAIAALLVAVGTLNLVLEKEARPRAALLSGMLVLGAVSVEYLSGLLAALASLAALRGRRKEEVLAFAAGAVLPLLALAAYHWTYFGSPLATSYRYRTLILHPRMLRFGNELIDSATVEFAYGWPSVRTLYELVLGRFRGLLFFSPLLLAALAGAGLALRRGARARPLAVAAIAGLVVFLVANASLRGELIWSGFPTNFGPRLLLPGMPLLLPLLAFSRGVSSRAGRIALLGCAAASVAICLAGALFQDHILVSEPGSELQRDGAVGTLALLLRDGPRVPLLDRMGVSSAIQLASLAAAVALSAAGFLLAKRRA